MAVMTENRVRAAMEEMEKQTAPKQRAEPSVARGMLFLLAVVAGWMGVFYVINYLTIHL